MTPGTENIIGQLNALSYGGIWVVSLLSNMIIPVPEEITLLGLGYLAGTGKIDIFILIPLVLSGLLISDTIVYMLSRKGSRFTKRIYEKFFAKTIQGHSQSWFDANIKKIIFFSRFLIQLRFIGPFLAGQKKIPIKQFITYDFLALVIYVPVYILLGKYFHTRVQSIINDINVIRNIVLLVAGVFVSYALFLFIKRLLFSEIEKTN